MNTNNHSVIMYTLVFFDDTITSFRQYSNRGHHKCTFQKQLDKVDTKTENSI